MNDTQYQLSSEERKVVDRTLDFIDGGPPEPLTESERNGLRAFLQRAETRLSTYQRVAGAFLNGAGLLVLLPTLARESISSSVHFALEGTDWPTRWVLLPWFIATCIPLYAFYLLLKDLVQFYFSPRFLELDPIRITRFSLAGITFPYDEGIEAKAQVLAMKMGAKGSEYANFILGGTSEKSVKQAHAASSGGKTAFPLRLEVMEQLKKGDRAADMNNAEVIGVGLSLAGSLDLSLVAEVARMEASVARHVLLLRKLVLRYSKALILFVWTTLILLSVVAVVGISPDVMSESRRALAAFTIYFVWAVLSICLLKWPLRWIESLLPDAKKRHPQTPFKDPDLQKFEAAIIGILAVAAFVFLLFSVVILLNILHGSLK